MDWTAQNSWICGKWNPKSMLFHSSQIVAFVIVDHERAPYHECFPTKVGTHFEVGILFLQLGMHS